MRTERNQKTCEFHTLGRREVLAGVDEGRFTSDAGGLLLRETERATGILRLLHRSSRSGPVRHDPAEAARDRGPHRRDGSEAVGLVERGLSG